MRRDRHINSLNAQSKQALNDVLIDNELLQKYLFMSIVEHLVMMSCHTLPTRGLCFNG